MRNWKTTLAGIFILLGIVGKDISAGGVKDPLGDFAVGSAAVGLIVAKDSNVTGGTVQQ